jgi:hypothetical protein
LIAMTSSSGYGYSVSGDQPLADLRTVGIRGVDEGDAEVHGPPQRGPGPVPVRRLAQTPGPVIRIAPYPSRAAVRSPPTSIMPAAAAVTVAFMDILSSRLPGRWSDR